MTVLQHLVGKVEHGYVNFDAQKFADVSQIIKKSSNSGLQNEWGQRRVVPAHSLR